MPKIQEIIRHVDFDADFDAIYLSFNQEYGFVEDRSVEEEPVESDSLARNGIVRVLGFATPIARGGGFDTSELVTPLVDFVDLPPKVQTIDEQGKGVGPRLCNVRESFGGARQVPEQIGVYTVDLYRDRILDGRADQGGKLARVAHHASRILRSKLTGVEDAVGRIHRSYGDVDAVLLEVPPHPELRRVRRGINNPEGITPQFLLIRNRAVSLRRIGTTSFYY